MYAMCLTMLAAVAVSADDAAKLVARAESTDRQVNGRQYERVKRNADGNVVHLRLDGMRLSKAEFHAISELETLEVLFLNRTNVTDDDLRCLRDLANLRCLVLTSTDISDAAIDGIQRLDGLRRVCMGDVLVAPDAVAKLKAARPKLAIGYGQRKLPTR